MPGQLLDDCLNEIFEYLEKDKITLSSCLLVNRHWCEISVRILWRDIWNFKPCRQHIPLAILDTLISCLLDKSKDLIYKKESTPNLTWKPPLFNYVSFCKVISMFGIEIMVDRVFESDTSTIQISKHLLSQEILKMFLNQISSLKYLNYNCLDYYILPYYPEAKNLLTNLRELNCFSDIETEFFHQISQTCNNIQSLNIQFGFNVSNKLANLISLQNNLKSLTLSYDYRKGLDIIIPSLTKISSTITKLTINNTFIPLLFLSKFTNLQELVFSFTFHFLRISNWEKTDDFYQLKEIRFPKLKILKFLYESSHLIQFLEINGNNLNEIYLRDNNNSLNLTIARFCPNLKILFTIFLNDEAETLKETLINCRYLESMNFWCNDDCLSEKEFLNIIAKYSPENFHKLEMCYVWTNSIILEKDLNEFFENWKNRTPQKLLSLIIIKDDETSGLLDNEENMMVAENYAKMGFFKKFIIKEYERQELLDYSETLDHDE